MDFFVTLLSFTISSTLFTHWVGDSRMQWRVLGSIILALLLVFPMMYASVTLLHYIVISVFDSDPESPERTNSSKVHMLDGPQLDAELSSLNPGHELNPGVFVKP